MRISQGWKWKISSVGGVLETVKQAQSHEITFRYSRSKAETQELCEDRGWILCPFFRKKLFIWWSVCGTIKWSPWNIWSTIYQTDHIWWDAHRPRKSPGLLILEQLPSSNSTPNSISTPSQFNSSKSWVGVMPYIWFSPPPTHPPTHHHITFLN